MEGNICSQMLVCNMWEWEKVEIFLVIGKKSLTTKNESEVGPNPIN